MYEELTDKDYFKDKIALISMVENVNDELYEKLDEKFTDNYPYYLYYTSDGLDVCVSFLNVKVFDLDLDSLRESCLKNRINSLVGKFKDVRVKEIDKAPERDEEDRLIVAVDSINKEILEILSRDFSNKSFLILDYTTDGMFEKVDFLGLEIFGENSDERLIDDESGDYIESKESFIRKRINYVLETLTSIKL